MDRVSRGPVSPLDRRTALALLAKAVAVTVLGFAVVALALWLSPELRPHAASILSWTALTLSLAVLAVLHVGLRRAEVGWGALGFEAPTRRMLHLLWQMPVVLVTLVVTQAVVFLGLGVEPLPEGDGVDRLFSGITPVTTVLLFVTVAVLVPLWEEAIHRGIVYGGLRRRLSRPTSVLLGAAVFSAAHGIPVLLPYYLTLGVSLALLYEFHRTLWAPVVAHMTLNGMVSLPLLLAGVR